LSDKTKPLLTKTLLTVLRTRFKRSSNEGITADLWGFMQQLKRNDGDDISGQLKAWYRTFRLVRNLHCFRRFRRQPTNGAPGAIQFYKLAKIDPGSTIAQQAIIWNPWP
jgi:hypothetical protein